MTDYDYKLYRSEYPWVIRVVWWSQSRDMKAPAGIGGGWDAEEVTSDDAYSCRILCGMMTRYWYCTGVRNRESGRSAYFEIVSD